MVPPANHRSIKKNDHLFLLLLLIVVILGFEVKITIKKR